MSKDKVHLGAPVTAVRSLSSGKLELRTSTGELDTFDHVILACHSDTAVQILREGNITEDEETILGKFAWNKNEAVLHSDIQVSHYLRP